MDNPLATATAEDLERWARALDELERSGHEFGLMPPYFEVLLGAAALARAVAKAERAGSFVWWRGGDVDDEPEISLPVALAALLEDDQ